MMGLEQINNEKTKNNLNKYKIIIGGLAISIGYLLSSNISDFGNDHEKIINIRQKQFFSDDLNPYILKWLNLSSQEQINLGLPNPNNPKYQELLSLTDKERKLYGYNSKYLELIKRLEDTL